MQTPINQHLTVNHKYNQTRFRTGDIHEQSKTPQASGTPLFLFLTNFESVMG
jgi:hypothetical protein